MKTQLLGIILFTLLPINVFSQNRVIDSTMAAFIKSTRELIDTTIIYSKTDIQVAKKTVIDKATEEVFKSVDKLIENSKSGKNSRESLGEINWQKYIYGEPDLTSSYESNNFSCTLLTWYSTKGHYRAVTISNNEILDEFLADPIK